jgi:predicted nucleic acid-binding protein
VTQFVDTNAFVYAFLAEGPKSETAFQLLSNGTVVISVQVLNEFVRVARGKHRLPWESVSSMRRAIVERAETVAALTLSLHNRAMLLAEQHTLPIYDSLILAAALDAGCDRLISEDFQHGRRFGTLEVVNPFSGNRA